MLAIEAENPSLKGVLPKEYARPQLSAVMVGELIDLISGIALGAQLTEGAGSRVKFALNGVDWIAHRPHPNKHALRYQLKELREFLLRLESLP